MKRMLVLAILFVGVANAADEKDQVVLKKALQKFNDFIGNYKAAGGPDKAKFDPKDGWEEKLEWSWRFKKDDVFITIGFDKGKVFKTAEIHYLPAKKKYEVTMTNADATKDVYTGDFDGEYFVMEFTDPKTKDVKRVKMNMAGEGARMIYRVETKPANREVFRKDFMVACSKEGESFSGGKKNLCVVTGGVGTGTVTYMGKSYYICCSGCRDAFNENPEKFVKEFEKGKK